MCIICTFEYTENIDKPVRLQSFSSIPSPIQIYCNTILQGQILNACKQAIKENCQHFKVLDFECEQTMFGSAHVATHADQDLIILVTSTIRLLSSV